MSQAKKELSSKPDAIRKRHQREQEKLHKKSLDDQEHRARTFAALLLQTGISGSVNIGGNVNSSNISTSQANPYAFLQPAYAHMFADQSNRHWNDCVSIMSRDGRRDVGTEDHRKLDADYTAELERRRNAIDAELARRPTDSADHVLSDTNASRSFVSPSDEAPAVGPDVSDANSLGFVPIPRSPAFDGVGEEFARPDASEAMLPSLVPTSDVTPAAGLSTLRKTLLDRLKREHILLLDEVLSHAHLEFFEHAKASFEDLGRSTSTIGGEVSRFHGIKNLQLNGGTTDIRDSLFKAHGDQWKSISFRGKSGVEWLTEIDTFLMNAIGMEDKTQPSSTAIHFQLVPRDRDFQVPGFSLPNHGQFAHLDDFQGLSDDSTTAFAVIAALDNMKSTEVMHSVNGVLPWCWECAASTSLNVKKGQIYVFLPGGVHRGPDSTVDVLSRSLYFAGCNWNIDQEEVTYDEARVQQLYLDDKKITDGGGTSTLPSGFRIQDPTLSCCPNAWDLAPEPADVQPWFLSSLRRWAVAKGADLRGPGTDLTLAATVRRAGKTTSQFSRNGLFDGFDKVFPEPYRTEFLGDHGLLNLFIRLVSGESSAYYQSFSCQTRNQPQTLVNKIAHGWHNDSHDVQQGERGGIIIVGLYFGNDDEGAPGSSTAEFKRSTRSRTHQITLKQGQYYIMNNPWKNGIHRFQSDVPRTMLRIGYGLTSEDGVQWSHAEHKKAKATRNGVQAKKRKVNNDQDNNGHAPTKRMSARLHPQDNHTGEENVLEPAMLGSVVSSPQVASGSLAGPRRRLDRQTGGSDVDQDEVQVIDAGTVAMRTPGKKIAIRGADGKFIPMVKNGRIQLVGKGSRSK